MAITIGLLVSLAGSIAIARSLQEMYEQIFGEDHRGWRDIGRHLVWVAVLVASLVAQAALVRTVRGAGPVVLVLVRFVAALVDTSEPIVYRLQEMVQVYGGAIAELVREEFGDGIISAIDFEMDLSRVADPKGDRVRVVLNGKFLPYRTW